MLAAIGLLLVIGVPSATAVPLGTITLFDTGLKERSSPRNLVVGPDGNLWFTDDVNTPAIGRITPNGEISEFNGPMTNASNPEGLVVGPEGYLWFTERGSIGRVSLDGTITEFRAGPDSNSAPGGLTLGPEGNVWFTEGGSTVAIGRITPSGEITEFTSGLKPGSQPKNIVSGPDGDLWFTDDGTTPAIGRVTPGGEITEYEAGLRTGSKPTGIVAGPDGDLWFTEGWELSKAIDRITPAGTITRFATGLGEEDCSLLCNVDGLVSGPDGNLWFRDSGGATVTIGRITPAGVVTQFDTGQGFRDSPQALVSGTEGNLWFADVGTMTVGSPGVGVAIGRITPSGAITEFSSGLFGSENPTDLTPGPEGNIWFADGSAIGRITTAEPPASSPELTTPLVTLAPSVGSVSLASKRIVTAASGKAKVRLTCMGTGTCRGTMVLTTKKNGRGGKRHTKTTTIGKATFSISPGRTTSIELEINAAGRALLRIGHGRLRVTLVVVKSSPLPSQTLVEKLPLLRWTTH